MNRLIPVILSALFVCLLVSCAHTTPTLSPAYQGENDFAKTQIAEIAKRQTDKMEWIAQKKDIEIPEEFHQLMRAAKQADWNTVQHMYNRVWPRSCQYESSVESDPAICNELWPAVHEMAWICRSLSTEWTPDLVTQYIRAMLSTLPPNSILFTGDDASRFLLMPFAELENRYDLIFISPNALLERSYADYLLELYGNRIWLPTEEERNAILANGLAAIEQGERSYEGIEIGDTEISVYGAKGIMDINNMLALEIVNQNIHQYRMFLVEGPPLRDLRPLLLPYGLIMEIMPEPVLTISQEEIQASRAYWAQVELKLFSNPHFAVERPVRTTYANMRRAIGNLYQFHGLPAYAEEAFQQADRLAPPTKVQIGN